jgi:pimeloyl-ACP methyl ester carboxylesterase
LGHFNGPDNAIEGKGMVPVIDGVLNLADGRELGYATYGPEDAPPVVYCHGFPANRLEFRLIQSVLERRGVGSRVVVLDRPGYGKSSFQPKRALLDWPKDVEAAADQLGLGTFSVVGVSGGGPYALACGYSLPDRVDRVGVAVGIAPREATGMEKAASIDGPSANPTLRRVQFAMAAFAFRKGQEDRFVDQTVATMSDVDGDALGDPEVRQWFIDMTREALVQGGRAAAHEAGLYRRSWGFDPAQVKVATDLWYGELDKTVPASAGRWLADRMPTAEIMVWPQHGHLSWMVSDQAAEVIAKAMG